jgi:hypothetical protein
VSLADFQRAFAIVVNDPDGWARRLLQPGASVGSLELSEVERTRLRRILVHPKMAANHLMLRANRLMPIQGALPLTCAWLSARLDDVLDAWLTDSHDASVQYQREATRFARWLPGFLGEAPHPALDALRYELALAELATQVVAGAASPSVALRFDCDPDLVLAGWSADVAPTNAPTFARLRVEGRAVVLERGDRPW